MRSLFIFQRNPIRYSHPANAILAAIGKNPCLANFNPVADYVIFTQLICLHKQISYFALVEKVLENTLVPLNCTL